MHHYHKKFYSHLYVHLFVQEGQHLCRYTSIMKSLEFSEVFTTFKINIEQNNEYCMFCLAIHLLLIEETASYANANYNANPLK